MSVNNNNENQSLDYKDYDNGKSDWIPLVNGIEGVAIILTKMETKGISGNNKKQHERKVAVILFKKENTRGNICDRLSNINFRNQSLN